MKDVIIEVIHNKTGHFFLSKSTKKNCHVRVKRLKKDILEQKYPRYIPFKDIVNPDTECTYQFYVKTNSLGL